MSYRRRALARRRVGARSGIRRQTSPARACGDHRGEPRRRARSFTVDGAEELQLSGLAPDDATALLARAPAGISDQRVIQHLVRATHGNPLGLLELPEALTKAQREGHEPLPDPLPVTDTVQAAFAGGLSGYRKRHSGRWPSRPPKHLDRSRSWRRRVSASVRA